MGFWNPSQGSDSGGGLTSSSWFPPFRVDFSHTHREESLLGHLFPMVFIPQTALLCYARPYSNIETASKTTW